MQSLKRLFIAIPVPLEDTPGYSNLAESLSKFSGKRDLSLTKAENYHLTIHFIGDTDTRDIPMLIHTLDQCLSMASSFELNLIGLGCFPNLAKPRILWMGTEKEEQLRSLYNKTIRELVKVTDTSKARYSPHLTLARLKPYAKQDTLNAIRNLVGDNLSTSFGVLQVKNVTLFESDLQSSGPVYKVIHKTMLK